MISLVQRLTTLGVLTAAVVWGWVLAEAGHPMWAAAGVAMLLLGHAAVLALEFCCLRYVAREHHERTTLLTSIPPLPAISHLLAAWAHEVVMAPRVFCWRQPFRANAEPDFLPQAKGKTGVVLVHGLVCNRAFWNPWMALLRRHGVPYLAVNLEPIFASIDRYSPQIESAVHAVELATGRPAVLVAHSMGGLAVRAWLARFASAPRARHVVTIGTPHRGTWLARFGHSASGVEMRLGSAWLSKLEGDENRRCEEMGATTTRFTCFYSNCDNIVFPAETATLPGADNRLIAGVAHVQLAFQADVLRQVLRIVAEADAQPSESSSGSISAPLREQVP